MPGLITRRTPKRGSTGRPGLKIVVPSTPHDARALMAAAVADPDPVLYYEHIALYRDPRIKQVLSDDAAGRRSPIGRAALRRDGRDLAIVSYGAYVHVALRVAASAGRRRDRRGVLDLAEPRAARSRRGPAVLARRCHRVLVVHEDTRTGSIGESIAAVDSGRGVRVARCAGRGSSARSIRRCPYSPPLEEFFLPSELQVERAARLLAAY